MKSVATISVSLLLVIVCVQFMSVIGSSGGGDTSWMRFAACLRSKLGFRALLNTGMVCAAKQMIIQFNQMNRVKCMNCDKYFHCQANYNAVAKCGRSGDAIKAATAISDCREFSQGGTDADSHADQVANRHGRSLQSCSKYLCGSNCKYSPSNGSCKRSNC